MADAQDSSGQGPILTPVDILGVIQRAMTDLHAYCGQPPASP